MIPTSPEKLPSRPGRRWLTFRHLLLLAASVGLTVLVVIAIPVVRWQLRIARERASAEAILEEVGLLGGQADYQTDWEGGVTDLTIDLRNTETGDESFAGLARMPGFMYIRILILRDTRITDQSLVTLSEAHPSLLSFLDVSRDNITDTGMESIADLTCLSTLYLSGTAVTDRGLESLAKRAGAIDLRGVDLTHTKVTEDGMKKLYKGFNFVTITHPLALHAKKIR